MAERNNEDTTPPTRGTTAPSPDIVLQRYSMELLKCLDEMRYKRDALHKQILTETKEKNKIQDDLKLLTDKLTKVNETLCDKMITMDKFNTAIEDTERAFSNLVVGSEHLLVYMKKITDKYLPNIKTPRTKEEEEGQKTKRSNKKTEGSTPRR